MDAEKTGREKNLNVFLNDTIGNLEHIQKSILELEEAIDRIAKPENRVREKSSTEPDKLPDETITDKLSIIHQASARFAGMLEDEVVRLKSLV